MQRAEARIISRVDERAEVALEWNALLRDRMLPYWHNTTVNSLGGYRVYDPGDRSWRVQLRSMIDGRNERSQNESLRGVISQARLLWVFSHAHLLGYSTPQQDYLKAATHGYSYLIETMLDREYGGFYWKADVHRGVIEPHKLLYGQTMAIYALVEYHRASGLSEPLEYARSAFEIVQQKFYDKTHGGWIEHCERDFTPLTCTGERLPGMPDIVGFKSGDAHLHLMEALTELYAEVRDASVRESLVETIELLCTNFYPADVSESCEYRLSDWKRVASDESSSTLSHGHMVEFAWLLLHAQQTLGLPRDWDHFESLLRHSLRHGFDHERGGFYFRGKPHETACDTTKLWWVQAEGLAALIDAVTRDSDEYNAALTRLTNWILNYQIRSADGVWIVSTDAEGRPQNVKKAGEWKAAYHEVRAITRFIQSFAPQAQYDCCQQ